METSVVRGLWCRTEILFTGCLTTSGTLWDVSLCETFYAKCTFMSNVPLCQVYLYVKHTFMANVLLYHMYLYVKCTFMWNVFMWSVPLWQMYLYGKCFYVKCTFMWSDFMPNVLCEMNLCEMILCQILLIHRTPWMIAWKMYLFNLFPKQICTGLRGLSTSLDSFRVNR